MIKSLHSVVGLSSSASGGITKVEFGGFEMKTEYAYPESCKIVKEESALQKQEGGKHYKNFIIQPVEFIVKNGLGFCEGNVIKYVCRHRQKGGVEDLRKARHYLELLAELAYGERL